jgi:hypothetical protein
VPWFVAVVAELHFSRQHWRRSAVFCNVAWFAAVAAYPFICAAVSHVPRLFAVPAEIFGGTLGCNMPDDEVKKK